ncbi:Protein RRP5, partial [Kappamyces sp. JEL0680]
NAENLYELGDPVKAYVIKVDAKSSKVSLSLKPSRLVEHLDSDESEDEAAADLHDEEMAPSSDVESEDEARSLQEDQDMDDSEAEEESNGSDEEAETETTVSGKKQALALDGFSWDANSSLQADNQASTSEADSEVEELDAKKSKRKKKQEKSAQEKKIAQEEVALLDTNREPEMPEDFERLLLASPNDSYLWIKYMAFQLELAEIDKARKIGDRALTTINFREDQERLNILVAYLNLEHKFGTTESLLAMFERACQLHDPKKVHIHMADIYVRNEQFDDAENLFKKMVKKFNLSCKVWLGYADFLIRQHRADEAKQVLKRSLQSLHTRKHVKMMIKYGQAEFKHGEAERGRTVFEGLIGKYPKKPDL